MVVPGLEKWLGQIEKYRKRRIALLVNQTSVTRNLRYSWDALRAEGIQVRRIFTPEHGLFSTEQDQVAVSREPSAPCQTVSLYGAAPESLIPHPETLSDIDLLVFDIQDVGCRYYTYVNTLALLMKAVRGKELEILVLDRPNPLGGTIEGPGLREGYESFVGVLRAPVRHGMTAGELALFFADSEHLDVPVHVVRMEGWKRSMLFPDTGLPWIAPSPNMPRFETALVYPGACLIEGLNVSEGRGTTAPFQTIGAPFIDPYEWADALDKLSLNGVFFRPVYFKPSFHQYAGKEAGGVFIHVTDPACFEPFLTGIALAETLHDLYGETLEFLHDVYEFNNLHPAFDLLTGSSTLREMIIAGSPLASMKGTWRSDTAGWEQNRKVFMLYGD